LPGIINNYFRSHNIVHDHDTRGSNNIGLHVTGVNNNYGRISIIKHIRLVKLAECDFAKTATNT